MSYDKPNVRRYSFAHDFGAGTDRYAVIGPKGKKGKLLDYGIDGVIETFNAVTTAASVAVGTAANPDAYGEEFELGTTAADSAVSVRSTYDPIADASSFNALMVDDDLPANTAVLLTCTAPTGGTPAGIATAWMDIQWDD